MITCKEFQNRLQAESGLQSCDNDRSAISSRFCITIYQDEDGMFIVECPSIHGCISQGKTEVAAVENVREAIKECLAVRAERGMPLIVTTRIIEIDM